MSRLCVITRPLLVLGLLSLVTPSVATAHFKGQSDWYVTGKTYESDGQAPKVNDPLNIFIYPYGAYEGEVVGHFNDHWRPVWAGDTQLKDHAIPCAGDQYVGFKSANGGFPRVRTSFHGAGVGGAISARECGTRYHFRFWKDAYHSAVSNQNHTYFESWMIAGAHYETVLGGNKYGHDIARDWDQVEWLTLTGRTKMRAHASNYRWRVLPGSKGRFGRFVSDGYISRIAARRHG